MKKEKSLSDLIKQANKSNPDHSLGEVKSLLDSGKKSALQHKLSYQPRWINKMFNPLNLIVMTLIIALLTTVLLVNPLKDKGSVRSFSQEFQVAGSTFQVEAEGELPDASQSITQNPINKELLSSDNSVKSTTETQNTPNHLNRSNHSITMAASAPKTPKDTTINGTIFELSKEQLEKLGFMFDDEGYYYLNKMPDGSLLNFWSFYGDLNSGKGGSYGFGKGGYINQSNKQTKTEFDFYPQIITDIAGNPIGQIFRKETRPIDPVEFEEMNDELLPVLFRYKDVGGQRKQDIIVWFRISDELIEILNNLEIKDQRYIDFLGAIAADGTDVKVDYNFEIEFNEFEGIKLDRETLECLGFSISDSALDYKYENNGDWITFFYNQTGVGYNNISISKFKNLQDSLMLIASPPLLCGMTDFLGKYHITLPSFMDVSQEGLGGDFFDYCIPIQTCEIIGLPNIEKTSFWFYPNERFFSCLPDSIGDPMRKEFNYHKRESGIVDEIIIEDFEPTSENEAIPCEYFPSFCEGLPGLDNIHLYPNPADNLINIDIILSKAKTIDYRIFDLGGRLLLDDHPRRIYKNEGKYTEKMDISSLTPGLYLLVLTDDEGARMTKRLVKN